MKFSQINVYLFILFVITVIPHFPSISYALARGLDFIYLFVIVGLVIVNSSPKIFLPSFIQFSLVILFLLLITIVLGSLNGFTLGYSDFSSFTDLYRPILWIFCLLLGAILANKVDISVIINFFKAITIFSLMIAILQKGSNIFYVLYSGPGHSISNRTTGICQDFADYSFLQVFGAILFFIDFKRKKSIKSFFMALILCFSVLLSTSKAGIGLMLGVLLIFFRELFVSKYITKKIKTASVIIVISIMCIGIMYIISNESFLRELTLLLAYDRDALPSISARENQKEFVYHMILDQINLNSIIGFGSAGLLKGSYIETAWLTILFRTGFLGLIIYYGFFATYIYNLYKIKEFRILSYFLLITVLIDFVAAMTNRILGISLFFIFSSYLITKKVNK